MLVTGVSNGGPVFMQDVAHTGLMGLSGSVPAGGCCLRATDSFKMKSLEVNFLWACAANSCC